MTNYSPKGPALFILSSFFLAVMAVFVKLASQYVPAGEIALVRFLVGLLAALFLAAAGKISLSSRRRRLMIGRGVFGGLAILFFFAAVDVGPVTNATVLNNTYPIFATIIAAIYLKERIKPAIIVPLLTSAAGIIMLTNPSFSSFRMGDLYGFASGVSAGVAVVIIRALRQTESAWSVFFYLSLFGAAFSLVIALPQMVIPGPVGLLFMFLAAVFGTVGQVVNTYAYKYCTTSVGATISMSNSVFASFFGLMFLGDMLSLAETIGAAVVLLSSGYIAYYGSAEPVERGDMTSSDRKEGSQLAVTIYTKVACPYCAAAKMSFEERNVEYTEINLTLDPDKIDEMVKLTGARKVPVIVEDGKVTVGWKGGG